QSVSIADVPALCVLAVALLRERLVAEVAVIRGDGEVAEPMLVLLLNLGSDLLAPEHLLPLSRKVLALREDVLDRPDETVLFLTPQVDTRLLGHGVLGQRREDEPGDVAVLLVDSPQEAGAELLVGH